ncbi:MULTISPECIES: serpin family protein [Bacillus]|uniref:serpin family protein n=1 Tax=Bacillus TaxID=1386 RepID=UPI00041653C5|nr:MULTISPECIES: serpin family protein [Bacillus]
MEMKLNWKTAAVWIALFLIAGCGGAKNTGPAPVPKQQSAPGAEPSFAAAEQQFAFELFRELVKQEGLSHNIFLSPYSVQQALVITANGAAEDSRKELLDALHLKRMRMTSINKASRSVKQFFHTLEHGELSVANSIWSRPDVKKSFADTIKGLGHAYQLDRDLQKAADNINDWTAKETKGRIEKIVDRVSPDTLALIINAVYFKESWKQPFDSNLTVPQKFYSSDGSSTKHPMMMQTNRLPYLENKDFQAVKLPYQDEHLAFVVILPKKTKTLQSLLPVMTYEHWRDWQKEWELKQVELKLPRFSFATEYVLNKPLKNMGMQTVFHHADFSNLFAEKTGGFISEVKHNTFIQVDEKGTEAGAATKVEIVESAAVPDVAMTVDRPFYFAVTDEKTGMLHFLGSIAKPTEK